MSIAGYEKKQTNVTFIDPAGSLKVLGMVAPFGGCTIHNVYASCSAAIASHASNTVTVSALDGGADGSGTDSMGSYGGASTAWAANEGNAMTLTQTGLDEGDHLIIQYAEGGTVAPGTVSVVIEWSQGGT